MITLQYAHNGGQFSDRCWCAVVDETQEAWDYGSLSYLEGQLQSAGIEYRVQRQHRDGTVSYRQPTIQEEQSGD